MTDVITAITSQKKNKHRFNIFINGQYAFSLNRELAETLKTGDLITEETIRRLKREDSHHTAFQRALYYLKFRPRSRMEVKQYLTGKKFPPEAVKSALTRLETIGYIDDRVFARLWVDNRQRLKPKGSYALSRELKEKGVAETIIRDILADFDENRSAWAAVTPLLNRIKNFERDTFKKKVYDFLNRRGFSYSICREICDQAWENQARTAEEQINDD